MDQVLEQQTSQPDRTGPKLTLVTAEPGQAVLTPPVLPGTHGAHGRPALRLSDSPPVSPVYLGAKRLIDIILSAVGLLLLFIPLGIVAVAIVCDSRGPVIYRRRVLAQQSAKASDDPASLHTFSAYKLRTMVTGADDLLLQSPTLLEEFKKDWKLENDPRITRLGARLRCWSIDEIPQVVNVLRGQMSLVGPRMITPPELARYGKYGPKLLSVKPGLTGLWQVSGRQELTYEERVRLDMLYIETRSFALDLQILLKTVVCVLRRQGAY